MRHQKIWLLSLCALSGAAWAENSVGDWVDAQHSKAANQVDSWARSMDKWFGTPNPDKPATANLRIMLDTTWNKHDDVKFKARVRGRVKLPTLERKVSVVFGDDSLDNEIVNRNHNETNPNDLSEKRWNNKQNREDNASIAVRWSDLSKQWGLETDADIGVRSGDDLYLRLKARKDVDLGNNYTFTAEQMYRYGIDSKHYARTSAEVRKTENPQTFVANFLHADYENQGDGDKWTWGNSLYRQHHFGQHRRLNYGVQVGGAINGDGHKLNSYGVFASWRQPIFRDWLFIQPEVSYSNNRDINRSHYPSAFFRIEAIF